MPATYDSCRITNVTSGECISLIRQVDVAYTNAFGAAGYIEVSCSGAVAAPFPAAVAGSGTVTVLLTHGAPSPVLHSISAVLKRDGTRVAGDSVRVYVGNPCPITVDGVPITPGALPSIDPLEIVKGKFDTAKGNQVFVLVEEKVIVAGAEIQPRLVFGEPADVDLEKGTWRHPAIPDAQSGQFLRAILTKNGTIKSMVRAIFD